MERLTDIEVDRVLTVLTSALENAHLLARVPLEVDGAFVDALDERGSYTLAEALLAQWQLEESAKVLSGGAGGGAAERGSGPAGAVSDPGAARIGKLVRRGARQLCRELRGDGEAVEALAARFEPNDGMLQMLAVLDALKELTDDRLRQTHEQTVRSSVAAEGVASRHRENLEARQELEAELLAQRTRHTAERAAVDEVLGKLEEEVAVIRRKLKIEEDTLGSTTKASREKMSERHQSHTVELHAEEEKLRREIAEAREQRRGIEKALRKRVAQLENEVASTITKYDARMLDLDKRITETKSLYTTEKGRLDKLQYHFDLLEADKHRADEEERMYQLEQTKLRDERMRKWNTAVTRVQSQFRGWYCRRHLDEFIPKKKKKKGCAHALRSNEAIKTIDSRTYRLSRRSLQLSVLPAGRREVKRRGRRALHEHGMSHLRQFSRLQFQDTGEPASPQLREAAAHLAGRLGISCIHRAYHTCHRSSANYAHNGIHCDLSTTAYPAPSDEFAHARNDRSQASHTSRCEYSRTIMGSALRRKHCTCPRTQQPSWEQKYASDMIT